MISSARLLRGVGKERGAKRERKSGGGGRVSIRKIRGGRRWGSGIVGRRRLAGGWGGGVRMGRC